MIGIISTDERGRAVAGIGLHLSRVIEAAALILPMIVAPLMCRKLGRVQHHINDGTNLSGDFAKLVKPVDLTMAEVTLCEGWTPKLKPVEEKSEV